MLSAPVLPRLALAAVVLAAVAGAIDKLGVAGYQYGSLAITFALPVAMAGVAWLLTRHPWPTAAIGVVAVVLAGVLATRAPWSTGRLEAALDDLHNIEGFEVLESHTEGHSWCRPQCPEVTRIWRAPNTGPKAAVLTMTLALSNAGLAPPMNQLTRDILTNQLVVKGTKANAVITAERVDDDDMRVTVILSSHR